MDWKEQLAALRNDVPQVEDTDNSETEQTANLQQTQTSPIRVLIDRKHRKGKTATIAEGFQCDDDRLKEIARSLRQSIGCGGSSRDGEILLQGDWRDRCATLLESMGYKVRKV